MNTDFPEDLFIAKNNYYSYLSNIQLGKEIAKDKTILFCGVVRNAEKYLERNILRILRTAQSFKTYKIFIYENDSEDSTKTILSKYNYDPFVITMEDGVPNDYLYQVKNNLDKNHALRCDRIAQCRNKYLQYLENHLFDYVCILDLDIRGGWSYDGFYDSIVLLEKDNNSCITSYGILADYRNEFPLEHIKDNNFIMYDSFAFRPYNFQHQMNTNFQSSFNFLKTHRGDIPVKVFSNFNGLGIYKYNTLKNKIYDIRIHNNDFVDCDHVVMHEKIRQDGGNIILNPNMIVSYADHEYSQL